MEERTINFILALVTGRVWGNKGSGVVDMWDCEPWIDFIRLCFIPCIFPNEKLNINITARFYRPWFLGGNFYSKKNLTTNEKKKAGI